jgi:hypothetical protein
MLEWIEIRIKTPRGNKKHLKIEIPQDRRDDKQDTFNDIASDYLDENKIEYKWFRLVGTCVVKRN